MNELVVSETQLMQFIGQYLWPMIRISGFYFMVPVIGARTVPARVRIILTLFTTLLFLSINGHAIVIHMLVDSFTTLPMSGAGLNTDNFLLIVSMGSWMFSAALVIALPLFTSLLIVNISFGVMSRSAPQMNIFAVGFPFTLLFGLLLIWFSLANFLPAFETVIEEGMAMVQTLVGIP